MAMRQSSSGSLRLSQNSSGQLRISQNSSGQRQLQVRIGGSPRGMSPGPLPGLIPAIFWDGEPPPYFRHFSALTDSKDRMRWARPRIMLIVGGLFTLILGGVIAANLDLGVFTDGAQAVGILTVIIGAMAFSIGCMLTFPEMLFEERPSSVFCAGALGLTCLWGLIVGSSLAASDAFERRLAGLVVVLVVVCLLLLWLCYFMLHTIGDHYLESSGSTSETIDPSNAYSVLDLAANQAIAAGAPRRPILWDLLRTPTFFAWFSPFFRLFFWSIVLVFTGGLFKCINKDIIDFGGGVLDVCGAIGEVLTCAGAALLIYAVPAVLVQFVPEDRIVSSDLVEAYPERVRNGVSVLAVQLPVLLFNAVWIVGRGADRLGNAESIPERFAATVLLVIGGCIGLVGAIRVAKTFFGIRMTEIFAQMQLDEEARVEVRSAPSDSSLPQDPQDAQPPQQLPVVPNAPEPNAGPDPPDDEMMPWPPRALQELPKERWPSGLSAVDAERILDAEPWRSWWHVQMRPIYLFPLLGICSGCIEVLRRDLWNPPPSAWLTLLAPFFGEVCAAMAALTFLYGLFISIHVVPLSAGLEVPFHALNFVWLILRAGHDFGGEEPGQRLAGMWLVLSALAQLRRCLMAVLVIAAHIVGTIPEEELTLLGELPRFFPVEHLAGLLKSGGRWSVSEFRREMHRDQVLSHWNLTMTTQLAGCFVLGLFGGLLKDDIIIPVLDLILERKVMDSEKHQDLHNLFIRPVGSLMAALGATLLLQRLVTPLVEAAMWIQNVGMPCRPQCADYTTAGVNAVWLVVYAAFEAGSDYTSQQIVGTLLVMLAVCRCGLFLGGSYFLYNGLKIPVPDGMPGPGHFEKDLQVKGPGDAALADGSRLSTSSIDSIPNEEPISTLFASRVDVTGRGTAGSSAGVAAVEAEPPLGAAAEQIGCSSGSAEVSRQRSSGSAEVSRQTSGFRMSLMDEPDMVALVKSLPLIAQLGLVEANEAPSRAAIRHWNLTKLGKLWLIVNICACAHFFFVSAILQKLWQPLREGEIDSRAVLAATGAITMVLTFGNFVYMAAKLAREAG